MLSLENWVNVIPVVSYMLRHFMLALSLLHLVELRWWYKWLSQEVVLNVDRPSSHSLTQQLPTWTCITSPNAANGIEDNQEGDNELATIDLIKKHLSVLLHRQSPPAAMEDANGAADKELQELTGLDQSALWVRHLEQLSPMHLFFTGWLHKECEWKIASFLCMYRPLAQPSHNWMKLIYTLFW